MGTNPVRRRAASGEHLGRDRFELCGESAFLTACENVPSGSLRITGKPSARNAASGVRRDRVSVRGVGTPCRLNSSCMNTLFEHLRIDCGSSITGMPSRSAACANANE